MLSLSKQAALEAPLRSYPEHVEEYEFWSAEDSGNIVSVMGCLDLRLPKTGGALFSREGEEHIGGGRVIIQYTRPS